MNIDDDVIITLDYEKLKLYFGCDFDRDVLVKLVETCIQKRLNINVNIGYNSISGSSEFDIDNCPNVLGTVLLAIRGAIEGFKLALSTVDILDNVGILSGG